MGGPARRPANLQAKAWAFLIGKRGLRRTPMGQTRPPGAPTPHLIGAAVVRAPGRQQRLGR